MLRSAFFVGVQDAGSSLRQSFCLPESPDDLNPSMSVRQLLDWSARSLARNLVAQGEDCALYRGLISQESGSFVGFGSFVRIVV